MNEGQVTEAQKLRWVIVPEKTRDAIGIGTRRYEAMEDVSPDTGRALTRFIFLDSHILKAECFCSQLATRAKQMDTSTRVEFSMQYTYSPF